MKILELKSLARTPVSSAVLREDTNRSEFSRTVEYSDSINGPANHSEITVTETVPSVSTKKNDAFVIDLNENSSPNPRKPPLRKQSSEVRLHFF